MQHYALVSFTDGKGFGLVNKYNAEQRRDNRQYRNLWQTEQAFRIAKTGLKIHPINMAEAIGIEKNNICIKIRHPVSNDAAHRTLPITEEHRMPANLLDF